MKLFKAFLMSMGMYSIVPVPNLWEDRLFPLVIPAFPVVGAVIGGLWFGFALLLTALGAPLMLTAVLLALAPSILSGFIHIDGLMDTCDAVFSRAALEKKRQILKDSHVGAFAVIGLCTYLLVAFAAVYSALEKQASLLPLLFIPPLSRAVGGSAMLLLRPMWETGYAATFKKDSKKVHQAVTLGFGTLTLLLGFLLGGFITGIILLCLVLGGVLAAWFSVRELKGISGDLCGFILVVSESTALLAWALVS